MEFSFRDTFYWIPQFYHTFRGSHRNRMLNLNNCLIISSSFILRLLCIEVIYTQNLIYGIAPTRSNNRIFNLPRGNIWGNPLQWSGIPVNTRFESPLRIAIWFSLFSEDIIEFCQKILLITLTGEKHIIHLMALPVVFENWFFS